MTEIVLTTRRSFWVIAYRRRTLSTLRFLINGGVIILGGSENFRKFNKLKISNFDCRRIFENLINLINKVLLNGGGGGGSEFQKMSKPL